MAALKTRTNALVESIPDDDGPGAVVTASDRAAYADGCRYDPVAAARVCDFFELFLVHSKGDFAAKPFVLQPWQRHYLSRLFGWRRADGTRRYRHSYLEIPKKNGKSMLVSGIALYMLFDEPGAEVYLGAVDRSQTANVFVECARMARSSSALARHLRVTDSRNTIVFEARNSKIVCMSADAPSKDGVSASCVVLDEVHRFKNDELYKVMRHSGIARRQPLHIQITTAGSDRHSLCYRLNQQARRVLDGNSIDTSLLPVIYAADPDDDLDSPATWRKANPSMGVIFPEEEFGRELATAKESAAEFNEFLRLRFNIWVESAVRWLDVEKWDKLAEPIPLEELEGLPCHAALDLSSVKDLTALVLVWTLEDLYGSPFVYAVPWFFVPEESAQARARQDKVPYPSWAKSGHLVSTPGNATDHEAIRKTIGELAERFAIESIGLDPWNAQNLASNLEADGHNVVAFRQGYGSMSGPAKELERMILDGRIKHNGNPCLRWCVANTTIETDASGNIKPSKKKSTEKIDGVVAMVMAVGLAAADAPAPEPSITVLGGPPSSPG